MTEPTNTAVGPPRVGPSHLRAGMPRRLRSGGSPRARHQVDIAEAGHETTRRRRAKGADQCVAQISRAAASIRPANNGTGGVTRDSVAADVVGECLVLVFELGQSGLDDVADRDDPGEVPVPVDHRQMADPTFGHE